MSPLELHAAESPDGIAYRLIPSGYSVTWRELELRSRLCAAAMVDAGMQTGDVIAVYLENHPCYFEILWAAHRVGLYYTTISRHLKQDEVQYIIEDADARLLFCSRETLNGIALARLAERGVQCVMMDDAVDGMVSYDAWIDRFGNDVSLPERPEGTDFCYSSGTTGKPKGIKRALATANKFFRAGDPARSAWKAFDRNSVYLSTAPFYHTAPVRWNMSVLRVGGTSVLMEKFDPAATLAAIEKYRITHGQFVPTMFIRMLRLPQQERERHDLSTLRFAVHAAAPCPASIKQDMIAWWGPRLYEYYSGTELVGRTSLDSQEWLTHKGSVGRAEFGQVHILDEEGREVATGQDGVIYFSGGPTFEYHNDPVKTRAAYNDRGWGTYGDIGHLDEEGYLYLTDRLSNMIVSGGVNIYPQEAENILAAHPAVQDVAVVGVPNPEFGEEVKAVVQLQPGQEPSAALAAELIAYCRERLSPVKCPRSVDFDATLPRTDAGKLLKRLVKQRYWPTDSKIAH